MNRLVFFAAMMVTSAWASTTYTFAGANYTSTTNFTTCTNGPCASFTTTMHVSGSFTLSTPLAPNLSFYSPTGQLTSFSFSNGITTFSSSDPNSRLANFLVSTDSAGNITNTILDLDEWQTGSSPHSAGDRTAELSINTYDPLTFGRNNAPCFLVGISPTTSVADSCNSYGGVGGALDSAESTAFVLSGSWSVSSAPTPAGAPALNEWGGIILTGLLIAVAWRSLRRQERLTPGA